MAKFHFRLQKVLEYRQLVEGWAKNAYLEARAERLKAEGDLTAIFDRRTELCRTEISSIDDRVALHRCFEKLEDNERAQRALIESLQFEEGKRQDEWTEKRRDLQALEKLRESAFAQFEVEDRRRDQRLLDEFAVLRHAA